MEQLTTYTFGLFILDTRTQLLCNDGASIKLTPKVYRLLLYFLVHAGRLISHEELFDKVWKGRIVEDSALRLAVNTLRKALHDESKSPQYILTVSKRGYRFLAEVHVNTSYLVAKIAESRLLTYQAQTQSPTRIDYAQELADLHAAFLHASNGKRHLIFLHGEQGIGKTDLLDCFLAKAPYSEMVVLRAHCVKMSRVVEPFLPLLDALEHGCRGLDGKLLIKRLHRIAPSWLYQMLNVLDVDEIAQLQLKVSHSNMGRMLREGADFIETLSDNSTFILILDNAQWCDEFTLDLLNFLMFSCSAAKLLVIVSYRSCKDEPALPRIAELRAELMPRGLCQDVFLQKG